MDHPRAVHIIDDDDAVRDSLAVLLEIRGVPVETYASARAFLAALADGAEGCVVTDVQMPGMNGLELLAALRARGHTLPVIVATARGGRAMAAEAVARGATALIEKPFAPDAFIDAVSEALGRG
ncbi:response regulator transcription factor [Phenylobacterium sp.]|uniref:response regulator transcription factor n=1 Tax=Phenylobacterium sp. TaxID=1871053 RepID=UPI002ED799D6